VQEGFVVGIKKMTGARIAVNLREDTRKTVDPPSILVYHPGRVIWKLLGLKLLGITALTGDENLAAIQEAAAAIDESDERDWANADAQRILDAVGSMPSPSHIAVDWVKGEGTMLFRAVQPGAPKAEELVYPEGSKRPQVSILPALRREGINIPRGMAMVVPVKLVLDDENHLALAASFRRSTLRELSQVGGEAGTQAKA
jgi:hypothetical protein